MIVEVVIALATRALDAPFSYAVPDGMELQVGDSVIVPLGNQKALGFVVSSEEKVKDETPHQRKRNEQNDASISFESEAQRWRRQVRGDNGGIQRSFDCARDVRGDKLKLVLARIPGPFFTKQAYPLASWIARYYAAPLSEAMKLFLPTGLATRLKKALAAYQETGEAKMPARRPRKSDEYAAQLNDPHVRPKQLTDGQEQALQAIIASLAGEGETQRSLDYARDVRGDNGEVFVLEGVTGSGKTEVYLQAIEAARKEGRTAILLVPEISLTPQTVGRIRSRFGDDVAVLHSGMTDGERYTQWEKARTGECGVVVGARSALFAPLSKLGLVIIDEEHDSSYKQSNSPRYQARDVAQRLCELAQATLVLGSATPSMEALHQIEEGRYQLLQLPQRVNQQDLPQVSIVDLRREFKDGNKTMFSRELKTALMQVQERQEKAILLLNRRGFANFLLCRDCGYVPGCEYCSTSLTYHAPQHHLRCHQCNCIKPVPAQCPECGSPYLKKFGEGVQRIEQEFRQQFPNWPLIRMDADTTSTRGAHADLLEQFSNIRTGVLLGTQMVAKGHDFPEVTLVGVINADITLNLPDFRASERGYQLLEQVAGRAGRGDLAGRVIIQTYSPDNPACQAVAAHDREILLQGERSLRRSFKYPPYAALCNVVMSGINEVKVKEFSQGLREALRGSKELQSMGAILMGPAPCMLALKSKSYRYHIMIKGPEGAALGPAVLAALKTVNKGRDIKVSVDVNPVDTF